jgi:hypothetical protein
MSAHGEKAELRRICEAWVHLPLDLDHYRPWLCLVHDASLGSGRSTTMAKALERPRALYDEDLLAWVEGQVAHLRAGRLDRLDVEHLIEELEAMAGRLRRGLKNRLRVLLAHLLKWQAQPGRHSRSWAAIIAEQRDHIEALLEENPSLRSSLEEVARSAYPRAVRLAAIETGLPRDAFPAEVPYTPADIVGDDLDHAEG